MVGRSRRFVRTGRREATGRVFKERGTLSLMTFAALFVSEKRDKRKSFFKYLRGRTMFDPCLGDANTHASRMCQSPYHAGRRWRRPLQTKTQVQPTEKAKNMYSIPSAHELPNFRTQSLTREVRHSLTWHSGESESALERFEPVAVVML